MKRFSIHFPHEKGTKISLITPFRLPFLSFPGYNLSERPVFHTPAGQKPHFRGTIARIPG
jgi:hypothetical protein